MERQGDVSLRFKELAHLVEVRGRPVKTGISQLRSSRPLEIYSRSPISQLTPGRRYDLLVAGPSGIGKTTTADKTALFLMYFNPDIALRGLSFEQLFDIEEEYINHIKYSYAYRLVRNNRDEELIDSERMLVSKIMRDQMDSSRTNIIDAPAGLLYERGQEVISENASNPDFYVFSLVTDFDADDINDEESVREVTKVTRSAAKSSKSTSEFEEKLKKEGVPIIFPKYAKNPYGEKVLVRSPRGWDEVVYPYFAIYSASAGEIDQLRDEAKLYYEQSEADSFIRRRITYYAGQVRLADRYRDPTMTKGKQLERLTRKVANEMRRLEDELRMPADRVAVCIVEKAKGPRVCDLRFRLKPEEYK